MFKVTPFLNSKSCALPFSLAMAKESTHFVVAFQVLMFGLQLAWIAVPDYVPDPDPTARRMRSLAKMDRRLTKAYADQRQKAPRNRKRKPSKAIANLYQLKGV